MAKSLGGGAVMVTLAVALWFPVVDAPVTVSCAVVWAALSAARTVSVADWPAVTELGSKDAVTPAGSPEIAKAMGTACPDATPVVTAKVFDEPA